MIFFIDFTSVGLSCLFIIFLSCLSNSALNYFFIPLFEHVIVSLFYIHVSLTLRPGSDLRYHFHYILKIHFYLIFVGILTLLSFPSISREENDRKDLYRRIRHGLYSKYVQYSTVHHPATCHCHLLFSSSSLERIHFWLCPIIFLCFCYPFVSCLVPPFLYFISFTVTVLVS